MTNLAPITASTGPVTAAPETANQSSRAKAVSP